MRIRSQGALAFNSGHVASPGTEYLRPALVLVRLAPADFSSWASQVIVTLLVPCAFLYGVCVGHWGQFLEELLYGVGHGEAGGSDADARPAAVTDHGHASVGHAFHQVTGEIAVAAIPDPLAVGRVEGVPPLAG